MENLRQENPLGKNSWGVLKEEFGSEEDQLEDYCSAPDKY